MSGSHDGKRRPVELAAEIVQAFVRRSALPHAELPKLVAAVGEVFAQLAKTEAAFDAESPTGGLSPMVIARTITHEYLISFEDGKAYRSLKGHLTARGMTPEEYRAKWKLPPDYPMVAPAFSQTRTKQMHDRAAKRRAKTAKEAAPQAAPAQLAHI